MQTKVMDDKALVAGFQSGDKRMYEQMFRKYYPMLCAYASSFDLSREDAEEHVQNLFYNLWDKKDSLQIQGQLKSYLLSSLKNRIFNQFRHEVVKRNYQAQLIRTDYAEENPAEFNELQRKIHEAMNNLPPERAKVFRMSREEGLKYREIAEKLDISVKTVENQMGKALKYLREELSEYLPLIVAIGISGFYLIFHGGMGVDTVLGVLSFS